MYDAGDPGQENIDELALHKYLNRAIQKLALDCLFKKVRANTSLAHEANQARKSLAILYFTACLIVQDPVKQAALALITLK